MQLLITFTRQFCKFTRFSSNNEGNEEPIQIVTEGGNEANIGIGSIWEEKQILVLQKLSDFTIGLSKSDFHEYYSTNTEDTCVYDDIEENDEKDLELGDPESNPKNNRTVVSVPLPGYPLCSTVGKRNASTLCAICLCAFEPGDRICWSSTATCPHVFHEECIVPWFTTLITKQRTTLRRRRERERRNNRGGNRQGNDSNTTNTNNRTAQEQNSIGGNSASVPTPAQTTASFLDQITEEIETFRNLSQTSGEFSTNFLLKSIPKECPCCRQKFISDEMAIPVLKEKETSIAQVVDSEATFHTSGSITSDGSSSFDRSSEQNHFDEDHITGQGQSEEIVNSVPRA